MHQNASFWSDEIEIFDKWLVSLDHVTYMCTFSLLLFFAFCQFVIFELSSLDQHIPYFHTFWCEINLVKKYMLTYWSEKRPWMTICILHTLYSMINECIKFSPWITHHCCGSIVMIINLLINYAICHEIHMCTMYIFTAVIFFAFCQFVKFELSSLHTVFPQFLMRDKFCGKGFIQGNLFLQHVSSWNGNEESVMIHRKMTSPTMYCKMSRENCS